MKKLSISFLIFLFAQISLSQESNLLNAIQKITYNNENVQVKAEFSKGEKQFNEYVAENLKKAFGKNIEKQFLVSFTVEIDGTLSNIEIVKDTTSDIEDKIKSIILSSPKWLPAEHEGYRVKAKIKLNLKL